MAELATNVLYYGDNLDILRRYLPDAAVDLVYLDPPCAGVSGARLRGHWT
jgi:16S rRNA G966 N2-methylase RsmD